MNTKTDARLQPNNNKPLPSMPPLFLHRGSNDSAVEALDQIRGKFQHFQSLLENHSLALRIISDLQEKLQGDYVFDTNYLRTSIQKLRGETSDIVANMIGLGGEVYLPLRERLNSVLNSIEGAFPKGCGAVEDDFIIPLDKLTRERAVSVGSKSAQLGEMRSLIGIPVPNGFAVSGWAYQHFINANGLQDRIKSRLKGLDIKRMDDLQRISLEIRELVASAPVPEDLASDILDAHGDLINRIGRDNVALRSSAVGEDTHFSFAGQYSTYLNVPRIDVIRRYRDVLAGKFTPQAIYYALSMAFSEHDFPMGVCFLEMVDAVAAGVIYTCDPVAPANGSYLVVAIFGLGRYLVEGRLAGDVFRLERQSGRLLSEQIVRKPFKLVMKTDGGTEEAMLDPVTSMRPALNSVQLRQIHLLVRRIEEHYVTPRDIEFAIDRQGRILFLQCRPLRVLKDLSMTTTAEREGESKNRIVARGNTVCTGVGSGPIRRLPVDRDLSALPSGCVLAIERPFPGMVTVLSRLAALITEVGGIASHMSTLAREYHIPTLVGVERASELPLNMYVTVDANNGLVYEGSIDSLNGSAKLTAPRLANSISHNLLYSLLNHIAPLNLFHSSDREFTIGHCRTLHDIIHYTHQKAMEEMFSSAHRLGKKWSICYRLRSDIPLLMDVIFLDRDPPSHRSRTFISESELQSELATAFWGGLREEGWPTKSRSSQGLENTLKGLDTQVFPDVNSDYSTNCYTILSREYMFLGLRMGYHFMTVEAFCTEETSKNYVRMQYKGGGAALERRTARIKLLGELLTELGFENRSRGDFLDAVSAYRTTAENLVLLRTLGRLTLLTKQLDMALSNLAMVQWYKEYFRRKLGLNSAAETKVEGHGESVN